MKLLALLGCAFTLGWILSWMYYDTSTTIANSNSAGSTALPQASSAASQSISHANAENALRQPDKANQTVTSASVLDVMLERLKRGEFEAVMGQYPVLQSTLSERRAEQSLSEFRALAWLQAAGEIEEQDSELAFKYAREALRMNDDPQIAAGVQAGIDRG